MNEYKPLVRRKIKGHNQDLREGQARETKRMKGKEAHRRGEMEVGATVGT